MARHLLEQAGLKAGTGNVVHVNALARVSHEGLAFDKNRNMNYIDEQNGGSIYKFTSATPDTGSTFANGGVNSVLRVGTGTTANAVGKPAQITFSRVLENPKVDCPR